MWIGYRIQWLEPNGKRGSKTISFAEHHGDKKAAYAAAIAELRRTVGDLQAVADGRKPYNPDRTTLGDFFDNEWWENRSKMKSRPKEDKQRFDDHIRDVLGYLELAKVDFSAIEKLKTKSLNKGLAPQTVVHVLSLLRAMLNYACERGFLGAVPKFRHAMPKPSEYAFQFLKNQTEVDQMLKAALEISTFEHAICAVAVYSGMRCGEICSLTWDRVDLERRRIHVVSSFAKPTKSGKLRAVPILDGLLPILERWQTEYPQNKPGLLFPSANGEMLKRHSPCFKEDWDNVRTAIGRPKIRFHDLRHSFVTLYATSETRWYELKDITGHADYRTMERYRHLVADKFQGGTGAFGLTNKEKKTRKRKGKNSR